MAASRSAPWRVTPRSSNSDVVQRVIPALAELAGWIGDPAVRNRGTHRRLDQQQRPGRRLSRRGPGPERHGPHQQARDQGRRLLHSACSRPRSSRTRSSRRSTSRGPTRPSTRSSANPASRYAMAGIFLARIGGEVRVAVTGAGPTVFRATDMERALSQNFSPAALDSITVDFVEPQQRPPRQRGVPRQPRQGHGQARGRGAGVGSGREGARPPPAPTLRCSLSLTSGPKLWWR